MNIPKIGLIDDHPLILEGLSILVGNLYSDRVEIVTAGSFLEAVRKFHLPLDLVVMDISLADGSDPVANVHTLAKSGTNVLLYTQHTQPRVVRPCLEAGAKGVITKDQASDQVAEAIQEALSGGYVINTEWAMALSDRSESPVPNLTFREREVLRLYASGLPAKTVARKMGISQETVNEKVKNIRKKYQKAGRQTSGRVGLYIAAVEDGFIDFPNASE